MLKKSGGTDGFHVQGILFSSPVFLPEGARDFLK